MAGVNDLNNDATDPETLMKQFDELTAAGGVIEDPAANIVATAGAGLEQGNGEKSATDKGKNDEVIQTAAGKDGAAAPGNNEEHAEGVATKDGKHVIPYSVLQSVRDRATRAEQLLQDTQERLKALEKPDGDKGVKTGESARTEAAQTPTVSDTDLGLSEEDLESLKQDFPSTYKSLMATQARVRDLESKLSAVAVVTDQQEQARVRTAADSVQDAIDSVPKLAHIQATNPDAFTEAKALDRLLRANPAWANKPVTERFHKVVELLEATNGPIELPKKPTPSPSNAELAKAARTAAQAAAIASNSSAPTSLSEFPAGLPAAADELGAAQQMSVAQLAIKIGSMTPDQQDAYFSSL